MSSATAGIRYTTSQSFSCDGRLFHSPGPAAPNALSPKVLYVRVARLRSLFYNNIKHILLQNKVHSPDK